MGITSINGITITASTSTSASVANTISVLNTATGVGPYYLTFVDATSGYKTLLVDNSTLTYNATSNTITATSFEGTASQATRILCPVNTSNNATNYLLFSPTFNAGGVTGLIPSESGNLTFNPFSTEFRAGIVNMQSNGQISTTSDANLTVDASLTQSIAWNVSLTTTRSLTINNLAAGRQFFAYIRNTNGTQRQIVFSGSATTTGQTGINMSVGAGAASVVTQSIAATTGTMLVYIQNIGGTLAGGIM